MRFTNTLVSLAVVNSISAHTIDTPEPRSPTQWPLHDNGLNDVVQWDRYSFKLNGKRLFLFSGELHYWRIPVPEVWQDLLEKIKAAGFTAFAFYGHWGYHAPNNHTLDFETGAHNFTKLFEIAKSVGLYVIVRPGPYVNAEANAGGFPLWLTTGAYGKLRDDDARYERAWKPYFAEFARRVRKYLVTNGGNVLLYQIENEYGEQWKERATRTPNQAAARYMAALEATARENGIDVPLIHNDPNMNSKSWSRDYAPNATGNVDVAGVDSYPACWSCNLDECAGTNGAYVPYKVMNYFDYFAEFSPTQPSFFPEFQGGSYNPWGGPAGGCPGDIGADFANLFYRNLISQRVTAVSLYMMYGGTNWGALACPVTATSYDYSAPIGEDRTIGEKFYETKNLALFTRVAEDLTVTERVGNGTRYTTNAAVLASELRNPDTGGAFYVTMHTYSPSATTEAFKLHVSTSIGNLTIPQHGGAIVLHGHQSKILVADFAMGKQHSLTYSTVEVLIYAIVDGTPVVVLWTGTGESAEFHVKNAQHITQTTGHTKATYHTDNHGILVNVASVRDMSVFEASNGVRIVLADRPTAHLFWAPNLSTDPFAPVNQSILIQGPYLVRSVRENHGSLHVRGDIANATTIEIFAPRRIRNLTWNNKPLPFTRTHYGTLKARLAGVRYRHNIRVPPLSNWKVHDALPEKQPGYDDSGPAWVDANHTSTQNPTKPDTLPVLYVDDYGIHNSFHLFRGYFDGPASAVQLSVHGGLAFGWSAWLNGRFLGSYLGNTTQGTGNMTLRFSDGSLNVNGTNVLLVVQDNTGHDLRAAALAPRGILSARLDGNASFTKWKIAGTAARDATQLDPIRGPLNEGGLTPERLGWHLPGFDDSSWPSSALSTPSSHAIAFTGAGIHFYRTTLPLNIPADLDTSFAFVFNVTGLSSRKIRVTLYVNGYQYGRFHPWVGNEVRFPVPPGVLDYSGENTVAMGVWAQSEEGTGPGARGLDVRVEMGEVVESGWDGRFEGAYLRPGWGEERGAYA